jgi:hypothetical protein
MEDDAANRGLRTASLSMTKLHSFQIIIAVASGG